MIISINRSNCFRNEMFLACAKSLLLHSHFDDFGRMIGVASGIKESPKEMFNNYL